MRKTGNFHADWTPVFETQRTFIHNYKTFQRSQFPVTPASGKTIYKAEGATVDKVVVDLSQKETRKIPHIHYVAFSRVKKLEDLYILNMNEAAMALDDDVNIEMKRLRTDATLELCYVPLYKIGSDKNKIAIMLEPCINVIRMFNLNQMYWQQISLDLLKQGYVVGMKMYILP